MSRVERNFDEFQPRPGCPRGGVGYSESLIDRDLGKRNFDPEVIRPLVALGGSLGLLVGIPLYAYRIAKRNSELEEAIKTGEAADNPEIMDEFRREMESIYGPEIASEVMRRIEEDHLSVNK